jgi:hypothetical protein
MYYKMITEAQKLLELGNNPTSPLAETSAKSDKTPMSPADLKKARELRLQNGSPTKSSPADIKKKIQ